MLKSADLLLIQSRPDKFATAIVDSTKDNADSSAYDHVALVEVTPTHKIFVLHTLPATGSIREAYAEFQKRHYTKIDLYRAKQPINAKPIIEQAKKLLNQPYNASYVPTAAGYYCADFIYYAFKEQQLFKLEPMNFMDQERQAILPFWRDYYTQLGCPIPSGELGLNPNAMLRQNVLTKLATLR
ncbi:YiiX/YebB-like N1pC/P60 family cysteine hydrolase [Loigolactobacillus iwatensis]|uniref:YiiX/YebB-like N1pC/P60 family cysteine hydrolase n=1 Tax=Loigolactobacillus iwatensis TaxID=1267156 RepID=UPI000F7DE4C5|nr:YiiX/YebB-like N1pC/P60 family cysteine hydrolase [Loigolactobacillus iwatensis]